MAEPHAGVDRLVGFGRYLRAQGLPVGTGRILTFCRAAAALDPFDREDLRWAARSTLISRPDDIEPLDRAFDRYFGTRLPESTGISMTPASIPPTRRVAEPQRNDRVGVAEQWSPAGAEGEEGEEKAAIRIVASDAERRRRKDFGEMTDEERRAALAVIRTLALPVPMRSSRRHRPAARPPGRSCRTGRYCRRDPGGPTTDS